MQRERIEPQGLVDVHLLYPVDVDESENEALLAAPAVLGYPLQVPQDRNAGDVFGVECGFPLLRAGLGLLDDRVENDCDCFNKSLYLVIFR